MVVPSEQKAISIFSGKLVNVSKLEGINLTLSLASLTSLLPTMKISLISFEAMNSFKRACPTTPLAPAIATFCINSPPKIKRAA